MLLISFSNQYDARLVLAKTHEQQNQLAEKDVHRLPALSKVHLLPALCVKEEEKTHKGWCFKKKLENLNCLTLNNGDKREE